MAVEILILSGARQGARLMFDGNRIRVGAESDCEVSFDLHHDPAAKGRAAVLQLEDDGWQIRSTGDGELIVNQQTAMGSTRLRSGDVIRLSASGPDFCFRLTSRVAQMPGDALPFPAVLRGPSPIIVPQPEPKPHEVIEAPATAGLAGSPAPMVSTTPSHWIKWGLAGVGVCLVVAVSWRILQPPPAPQVTIHIGEKAGEATKGGKDVVKSEAGPIQPKSETPQPSVAKPSSPVKPTVPVTESVLIQLRDTVFLLEVEKAGRYWPFATCIAVGRDTLLTSAREAMQLAAWRDNEGFKVWIVNSTLGIKKEVREIRLHGVFATLADKPNDWIYFNLALLGVDGNLPKIAPLASSEELREEAAVSCVGFAHEGRKSGAARQFKPELFQGSIFLTTVARNLPGQPRLLHIEAKIPQNMYGSPVLDEMGRVIGIYGDAALPADQDASPADAAMKDIHFASIVSPEVIRLWTEKRDEKMWVLPAVLKAPSQPSVNESDQIGRSRNGGS